MMEYITNIVDETSLQVAQERFSSVKEEIQEPIFPLFEEAPIDVVEQGLLDTLLIHSLYELAEWNYFMDVLGQRMAESNSSIKPLAHFLKHSMDKVNDKCPLECKLERNTRTNRLVQRKGNDDTTV